MREIQTKIQKNTISVFRKHLITSAERKLLHEYHYRRNECGIQNKYPYVKTFLPFDYPRQRHISLVGDVCAWNDAEIKPLLNQNFYLLSMASLFFATFLTIC